MNENVESKQNHILVVVVVVVVVVVARDADDPKSGTFNPHIQIRSQGSHKKEG